VLLIDEAYNIGTSDKDSFARECVDTLNQCLSEQKKDFVCIIVGYKKALKQNIFSLNEGLERRFSWTYDMGDTSAEVLRAIFTSQVRGANWSIHKKAIPARFFADKLKSFPAGGGSTELFFGKCKFAYAIRNFGRVGGQRVINRADFLAGFSVFNDNAVGKPDKKEDVPLGMYS